MAKKENQRVMLTKTLLKNSLTELLKEKSIYKVSIRELCEKAEINRSTFYKYYDSQFDLLTEMEDDIISLVVKSLPGSVAKDDHSLCVVLQYLEDNLELSRLLINNNIDPQFPEKIFGLPQVRRLVTSTLGNKYTESEYEYVSNFLTYGAYQIIRIWINKDDREPTDEIVSLIIHRTMGAGQE